MVLLYNENKQLDINNRLLLLNEEKSISYVNYMKSKGLAEIGKKDLKALGAFYVKENYERAFSLAKFALQNNFNNEKMEGFT